MQEAAFTVNTFSQTTKKQPYCVDDHKNCSNTFWFENCMTL